MDGHNPLPIKSIGGKRCSPALWHASCEEYGTDSKSNTCGDDGQVDGLRDQQVQFKICDVYHPHPTEVLLDLYGDDLLTGKVVELSDSGMQREAFAVVEVEGIVKLLIVPVERIRRTP
jgi:hypothetical protein